MSDRPRSLLEWMPVPQQPTGEYGAASPAPDPFARVDLAPIWFGPLRTLNIFVGPNNSGKTRLLQIGFGEGLRHKRQYVPTGFDYASHAKAREDKVDELAVALGKAASVNAIQDQRLNQEADQLSQWLEASEASFRANLLTPTPNAPFQELRTKLESLLSVLRRSNAHAKQLQRRAEAFEQHCRELETAARQVFAPSRLRFVLVPSRRAMGEDQAPHPHVKASSSKADGLEVLREVFTGADLYRHIRRMLLGNLADRRRIDGFQKFLGREFFCGEQVTLTPAENEDGSPKGLMIKIGREPDRPIYQLGDGIQQIIILAFPIFEYAAEHLVLFIDEPELSLHPGLQRVFASVCLDHPCEEGATRQVLICTHSNHLLDLTIDRGRTAIFRVSKDLPQPSDDLEEVEPHFTIEAYTDEDHGGSLDLLRDLGAQNTSMLLSNCAIWVEGVSDRNYYRKFLGLLMEEQGIHSLHEDTHYSFLEYGGGNIAHWSFLEDGAPNAQRITSRMMVICDRDDDAKTPRHDKLREALGDENVFVLESKEVENLLTPEVIKATVKALEAGKINPTAEFAQDDFRDVPMGKFIDEVVLSDSPTKRCGGTNRKQGEYRYGDRYGTLKNKAKFSSTACELMTATSDLSREAREIAEVMLRFVQAHNAPRIGARRLHLSTAGETMDQ